MVFLRSVVANDDVPVHARREPQQQALARAISEGEDPRGLASLRADPDA